MRRACEGVGGACMAVLALWAGLSAGADAQAAQNAEARREVLLGAARQIMEAARYAAVITVDESGRPQARTIDVFAPESDMVVWFATNPKTRKVEQLRRDPRVTLYYFDTRAPELGFVTLFGRARLVDDRSEKQKRWKQGWEAFWPDRDASYLLVEVTPEALEVVSPKLGVEPDPVTWKPPTVTFTRTEANRH